MSSQSASVQVVVRLRPMNEFETKHGTLPVIAASGQDKTITVIKGQGPRQVRSSFTFDNVFSAFSTQKEIFDATLKPVISDVMQGYESTIFAYGQTGTGKTYTMEGDLTSSEQHGIIPRAALAIFEVLKKPEFTTFAIYCSYLEIYNEDLGDLLADDLQSSSGGKVTKLEIMDSKEGTFCRGLTEKSVESADDVLALMQQAQQYRKVGETRMNKNSSRSHCIFTIRIQAKRTLMDGTILDVTGKLHMVDLAGSECAKTAGLDKAVGPESAARERERMNINRSLLTLGRVIKTLREQSDSKKPQQNIRIPYRDSKLTRILQESLGGRCKTLIIATLSPSITAIEESMSTLNYAQTAIGIVNKPLSSSFISITPAGFNGNSSSNDTSSSEYSSVAESWIEMECRLQYMQAQVDEAQAALARKHLQQQEFLDKIDRLEEEKLDLERQHFNTTQALNRTTAELTKEREEKEYLSGRLQDTELTLKRTTAVLRATQQTEINLTSEATALLNTLREAIVDGDGLYKLLEEAREVEKRTKTATKLFQTSMLSNLDAITSSLHDLSSKAKQHNSAMTASVVSNHADEHRALAESLELIESVKNTARHLSDLLRSHTIDEDGLSPAITKLCTSINNIIDAMRIELDGSESALVAALSSLLAVVEQHTTTLNDMNERFLSISASTSVNLQQLIGNLRDSYTSIITKASDSIKTLRCYNESSRSDLAALISDWNSTSETALLDVDSKASAQSSRLVTSITNFEKDWRHHKDMQLLISNQSIFMRKYGDSHNQALAALTDKLALQKEAYVQQSRNQQRMRDDFMKCVMEGVQAVVKSEVDKMVSEQSIFLSSIDSRNCELIGTGDDLRSGSASILQNVDETSSALSDAIEAAAQSNRDMRDVAVEARVCLDGIRESSQRCRDEVTLHTESARRLLDDMNNQDATLSGAVNCMVSDSVRCSEEDANQLLLISRESIRQLTAAGTDMYNCATQQMASDTRTAVETLRNKRDPVYSSLSKNLGEAVCMTSETEKVVKDMVQTIAQVSHDMSGEIESSIDLYHNTIAPQNRAAIDLRKESLLQRIQSIQDLSSTVISSSSGKLRCGKENVVDFSNNTVGVNRAVPSIDARRNFVFSDKLSATHISDSTDEDSCHSRRTALHVKSDPENNIKSSSVPLRSSESMDVPASLTIRTASPLRERSLNNVISDINLFMKNCSSSSSVGSFRRVGQLPHQPITSGKSESSVSNLRTAFPGSPMGNSGKKRSVATPTNTSAKRNKA